MEIPNSGEIDAMLSEILRPKPTHRGVLRDDDHAFVRRMVESVDTGKGRGIFMVLNSDNSLDYMLFNDTRIGAIQLLARMIQRTAKHVEEDGSD